VKTKERRYTKDIHQQITLFPFSTGNNIGDRGATSLSESLKSNTTLTELDLRSESKRKIIQDIHRQIILFFAQQATTLEMQE
jgi:hypothetical protein